MVETHDDRLAIQAKLMKMMKNKNKEETKAKKKLVFLFI